MARVLVIDGADFSENKIESLTIIGGKQITFKNVEVKEEWYLRDVDGIPTEVSLNLWRTSGYVSVDGEVISGKSNYFDVNGITTCMIAFYDENKNFISYSNEIMKFVYGSSTSGDIRAGYFNLKIPTNAKYARFSWKFTGDNDLVNVDYPLVYVR